jgi:hypothetical protein
VEVQAIAHVVDAPGVEGAAAPDQAMDVVALVEQQLRQVAAVLPGDARDEGRLSLLAASRRSLRSFRQAARL